MPSNEKEFCTITVNTLQVTPCCIAQSVSMTRSVLYIDFISLYKTPQAVFKDDLRLLLRVIASSNKEELVVASTISKFHNRVH